MKHDAALVAALLCLPLASAARCQKNGRTPSPVEHVAIDFGAKGQCRVWLAVDSGAVFVDRNANGDSTDPDERIVPNDRGDFVTDLPACDEKGRKESFRLTVTVGHDPHGRLGIKCLSVHPVADIQRFHSTAGFISLGKSRASAPVVPIHGPLRFVLMDHWTGSTACRVLPDAGGEHEFSILVATPVRGSKTEAYVYPNLWILEPEKLPTIRAEFEPRDTRAGATSPDVRIWMCECARRYRCRLQVPPAATTLRASLRVSFPGWRHGELKPETFELEYHKPRSKSDRGSGARKRRQLG